MLGDNVQRNLSKLSTKRHAKRHVRGCLVLLPEKDSLVQDAIARTSAQENVPHEAAGTGSDTTTTEHT